ncbi:MAG TPA: hypothetical protein VFN35_06560 [Ktedonobacteraceae bacterium]|nr:hypothetical protein [Ktedonobacteraceae bacterium]
MTEHEFPLEQMHVAARETATATLLGAVAYMQKQSHPTQDFVHFLGEHFAPTWKQLEGQGAMAVMNVIAMEMVALGGSLRALSGSETHAEGVFADWPSADFLALFELTPVGGSDVLWEIFTPVAAYLHLEYEWHREDDQVRLILSHE